jgi:putative membrane protein
MRSKWIIGSLAVALVAGCQSDQEHQRGIGYVPPPDARISDDYPRTVHSDSAQPISRNAQVSQQLEAFDRQFFAEAFSGNLLEIRTAEMALRESLDDQRRGNVERIRTDHTRANQQLESIAQAKGLLTPEQMQPKHQAMLDSLRELQGQEFLNQFHQIQLEAHEQAVRQYEQAVLNVQDRDLRTYAQRTLPLLQEHLLQMRLHASQQPEQQPAREQGQEHEHDQQAQPH